MSGEGDGGVRTPLENPADRLGDTAEPIAEQWYQNLDDGRTFKVVALDDAAGTVEIQHFDGQIDSLERAAWDRLNLAHAARPVDWTGAADHVEDDSGYTDRGVQPEGEHIRKPRR